MADEPHSATLPAEAPLVGGRHDFATVTDKISSVVLRRRTPRGWFIGVAISASLMMLLFFSLAVLVTKGVGIWGINIPVAWGFDIINFVCSGATATAGPASFYAVIQVA